MNTISRLLFAAAFVAALFANSVQAQATVYNLNATSLAQITGSPGARVLAPTYAATITSVNPNAGIVHWINGVAATSATSTINMAGGGQSDQLMILIIRDTGGVTVTFGTNMKSAGTVNPTTGKQIAVWFVSDGTNWVENFRTATAVTF